MQGYAGVSCLGCYPGSNKTYGNREHSPPAWPDTLSFEGIKHVSVSHMKLKDMNLVLESLLQHRNIDILKYHVSSAESEARNLSEKRKRRRPQQRSAELVLDESAESELEVPAVQSSSSTDHPPQPSSSSNAPPPQPSSSSNAPPPQPSSSSSTPQPLSSSSPNLSLLSTASASSPINSQEINVLTDESGVVTLNQRARKLVKFAGNNKIFDSDADTEPEEDEEDIEKRLKYDDAVAEEENEEEMYRKYFNNVSDSDLDISG